MSYTIATRIFIGDENRVYFWGNNSLKCNKKNAGFIRGTVIKILLYLVDNITYVTELLLS